MTLVPRISKILMAGAVLAAASHTILAAGRSGGRPPQPLSNDAPQQVRVGDMVLFVEQLEEWRSEPRVRAQGHAIDYRSTVGMWDSGVIPYELDPGFSSSERARILAMMERWSRVAPLLFVPRTSQTGYLAITREDAGDAISACYSYVGQYMRGIRVQTNLGSTCAGNDRNVSHELGHAVGLHHEHQRADRDRFVTVNFSNISGDARSQFEKFNLPLIGPYDFGSVMHYRSTHFAADVSQPSMTPAPGYESFAPIMGAATLPSQTDEDVVATLYAFELREPGALVFGEAPRRSFSRADLLLALERLHAFYMSRYGLQRPQGLSIDGRPDFLGIAQWIFDVYVPTRSAGVSPDLAFAHVRAAITQSSEWRVKHPSRRALTPLPDVPAAVRLDRDEYLDVLERLDRFYAAPDGLQRPQGLSIAGGPDFVGIATWIFDVYLNERLRGMSSTAAWTVVENAIRSTDEWRRKH